MNFKEIIAKLIAKAIKKNDLKNELNIDEKFVNDIESFIEIPKETSNGDFSFPCFRLAKQLKQSPVVIANNIKDAMEVDDKLLEKVESINGFLNFYIAKTEIVKETVEKFDTQKEDYGKSNMGNNLTVLVEYSSPNIAKPFHIGHLKTTILGASLYNIYKFLGYTTVGLNHLGDYGTQFAKLIEGYKRWGNEYDFSTESIDKMAALYKRINDLCEEDESVLEQCRDTFSKLESGDPYCVKVWNEFKDLSLKEFKRIYDLLGVKFDSTNGESFYSDKMDEVIKLLEKSGKLETSEGAKIVNLEDVGINTPCIIQKANGSSIYATRDLAAVLYRARTYDFDKCLYVVAIEQNLHFRQVFATARYLGLDEKYLKGLEHVSYGMIRLPEGKMSTRKGNFVKVEDLLNESITRVKQIIVNKEDAAENINLNELDNIAKKVGIGAVIFWNLSENRIKDQVFSLDEALNFNGETGPYVQYMAVRTNSVLNKAGYVPNAKDINLEKLCDNQSIEVIKLISDFQNVVINAMEKNDPSFISRYLIDLAQAYSSFYNVNKIICEDKEVQDARLYLTYMTKVTLTQGLNLLGISVPEKM